MTERVLDTFASLKEQEDLYPAPSPYFTYSGVADNRRMLVSWLWDVKEGAGIGDDAMACAVRIIDTYFSKNSVDISRLQLVGIVALTMGSKVYDVTQFKIKRIPYITDGTYTVDEATTCERELFKSLDFHLTWPLVTSYVQTEGHSRLRFLFEMSTIGERLIGYPPSTIAMTIVEISSNVSSSTHPACFRDMKTTIAESATWNPNVIKEIRNRNPGMLSPAAF